MTQQPYYPPQAPPQQYQPPAQPQQPYAGQPQYPGFPGQPAPQPQFQQPYPQQGYAAPPPQQPPAAPLADGSIDAFYSQPNTGGGPGVSWKGKPDGYTVQGVVTRDVANGDVVQETGAPGSPNAGQPLFYRDGRPKFAMAVPLTLAPSQEFPEGEARLFVRGQLRDELQRAMQEAGAEGAPKAGAVLTVTLVQRKQGRGTIPMNVFAVTYTPAGGQPPQAPQVQQPAQPQYAPPAQQAYPPQQYAQPIQQQAAPQGAPQGQPQYAPQGLPVQQGAGAPSPAPVAQQPQQYAQPVQPVQQQVPAPQGQDQPQAQGGLQMPPDFNAEQQALMARITSGQQG